MMEDSQKYIRWLNQNKEELIYISNQIWGFAEGGFEEHKSSRLLAGCLERAGFEVNLGVSSIPTAFTASFGDDGAVIAVLGEYDALPGLNQEKKPYRSAIVEGGMGHGCGHNLLCTGTLGAILAIQKAIKSKVFKGTIRYYGCPAEEIFNTKGYMIDPGGLFDDVDICITWHPQAINTVRLNSLSAGNSFSLKFKGSKAFQAVKRVNKSFKRVKNQFDSEVKVRHIIKKKNLESEIYYTIRAPVRHQVEEVYQFLVKIGQQISKNVSCNMRVEFLDGTYHHLRNHNLSQVLQEVMKIVGPPKFNPNEKKFAFELKKTLNPKNINKLKEIVPPHFRDIVENESLCEFIIPQTGEGEIGGGCSDVGDVSWNVPLGEFWTTCNVMGGTNHSWQATATSGMSIGHKGMIMASKVITLTALKLMKNPKIIEKIQTEFKRKTKEVSYKSPFPDDFKPPIDIREKLKVR